MIFNMSRNIYFKNNPTFSLKTELFNNKVSRNLAFYLVASCILKSFNAEKHT